MKEAGLKELERIPGVGKKIAEDMRNIGIRCIDDLKGQRAEELYQRLCDFKVSPVDRCMLYVFRCAVYYASKKRHKPELLKWWNWKDEK